MRPNGFSKYDKRLVKICLAIRIQISYNLVTKENNEQQEINEEEARDMRKRILCLMLCLTAVCSIGSYAMAAEETAETQVITEEITGPYFLVDGVAYEDPGMTV